MKVFISWSGERSKLVAELLNDWLKCVIQAVDPWVSSKDVDRGILWFSEVTDQLSNTLIGIVCLTKTNKEKPWILFEAGALAKGLSTSRVCTLLVDLEPRDIRDPLAQFNHTMPTEEGIFQLVRTLNNSLNENRLQENILKKVFETYWPQFKIGFKEILETTREEDIEVETSKEELLSEVLGVVRTMDRRLRTIESKETFGQHVLRYDDSPYPISNKKLISIVHKYQERGLSDREILKELEGEIPARELIRVFNTRLLHNYLQEIKYIR